MSASATTKPKTATAAAWKKAKRHEGLTLPSGTVVSVELPNVPKMIKSGTLPNELLDAALEHQGVDKVTRDVIEQTWAYTCFIVPRTVVSPEVTEEDVPDLPAEDIEMIVNWAARTSDLDAVGHHLAGLEVQSDFRQFRGLLTPEEVVRQL